MEPKNALMAALIFFSGCVVKSPVPYKGDVDGKNVPLRAVFDPEGASYQQPPFPAVPERGQRQQQQEERANEYDYFYIHTKDGQELRRKKSH